MFRVKVSISTAALQQPIKLALQTAGEMGAQGVQFDVRQEITLRDYGETGRRQLLHELTEHGLQAASAHFPLRSQLADPDHLDQRLNGIKAGMDLASQLKIRLLTLRVGSLPPVEQAAKRDLFISLLADLASHGNRTGVIPCLIPSGDEADELRELIDQIRTGPVAVDGDLAAWVLHGQKPIHELRELHAVVRHIEVRDAIGGVDGAGREVPVGRGEIDWDEVAALLDEMEYAGWLNVSRTAGNDRVGDIARAVQYMRNLFLIGETK